MLDLTGLRHENYHDEKSNRFGYGGRPQSSTLGRKPPTVHDNFRLPSFLCQLSFVNRCSQESILETEVNISIFPWSIEEFRVFDTNLNKYIEDGKPGCPPDSWRNAISIANPWGMAGPSGLRPRNERKFKCRVLWWNPVWLPGSNLATHYFFLLHYEVSIIHKGQGRLA